MVQLTNKGHYSEEVPTDAEQLSCSVQDDGIPCLTYFSGQNIEPTVICLPPGSWRFLFTTKGATEEQAMRVVNRYKDGWNDYDYSDIYCCIPYSTAKQSLRSLLRSKGLDPNKNHALIQNLTENATE